jgi:MarR-like DNA-binding transcriptional regulator SgrR of sgrS sRNA
MDQQETVEQVYAFIKDYIREHTYPPTLKEIAAGCFMSRTHVTRYVDWLQALGRIARDSKLARGITLLDDHDPQA